MALKKQGCRMIIRPPQGREIFHLWIAISIIVVLSLYTLAVQLMDPLQDYVIPHTQLPAVKAVVFLLYLWLLSLLLIAYHRWQHAIERRRELETVVASINPDALLVVNPDRKIQMCNTSVKSMFGYEPEELIGNTTDKLYYDRRLQPDSDEIARCLRHFGFHIGYATGKRGHGETFPLEIITADLSGQPGAVVLARDITERKQAEEALRISYEKQQSALQQLRQTQQQVIQHERLRMLGKMASYIAHEFNNALTPIIGFSEMMLDNFDITKNPDELRAYLEDINTAAHDASSVVHRLREFYKVDAATEIRDRVDLNKTINNTISLTRPKWKSEAQSTGRDIEFDLELGEVPDIPGNPEEIREALTNLIFNAVDAMPNGGTLTIGTKVDNDQVFIKVRDNGNGMSPEVRQHCFEPFYSTDSSNGSGLGLVVVASIVQRHNGTIECDSAPGKGTKFTIKLPVSTEPAKLSDTETLNVVTPELRILVVDDEMLIRKLLVQFLEHEGHQVETATTGREGYDKFKAGEYDLIITDWAMPEMNGAELCQKVKDENPNISIILMTGFDGIRRQEAKQTIAADIVIGKPITHKELLDSINRIPAA